MSEILLHKNFSEEQMQESSVVRRRESRKFQRIDLSVVL
jgi:hypothetical protein